MSRRRASAPAHRTAADLTTERDRIAEHLVAAERRLANHQDTTPPEDSAAFQMWCRRNDRLARHCDGLEHALKIIRHRIERAQRREQRQEAHPGVPA